MGAAVVTGALVLVGGADPALARATHRAAAARAQPSACAGTNSLKVTLQPGTQLEGLLARVLGNQFQTGLSLPATPVTHKTKIEVCTQGSTRIAIQNY